MDRKPRVFLSRTSAGLKATAEGPIVINAKRTIQSKGGVGKTRAAVECAGKHADDNRALLFISADNPESQFPRIEAITPRWLKKI